MIPEQTPVTGSLFELSLPRSWRRPLLGRPSLILGGALLSIPRHSHGATTIYGAGNITNGPEDAGSRLATPRDPSLCHQSG